MKKSRLIILVVAIIISLLAWAGSHHGHYLGSAPLFALAVLAALIIQWIACVPSLLARTEKYYDLMGGVTYISLTIILLLLTPTVSYAGWFLGLMVIAWSGRLSSFLFARVRGAEDQRFHDIKMNPGKFLVTWMLQGLWVAAVTSPAWIAITSTKDRLTHPVLDRCSGVGSRVCDRNRGRQAKVGFPREPCKHGPLHHHRIVGTKPSP